jgi:Na+/melibiose symporter-like transporter
MSLENKKTYQTGAKVQAMLNTMEKQIVKPTALLLCVVVLCLLNTYAFGQQPEKSSSEFEAFKNLAQIFGYIFIAIFTAINIYYGIKNQNHKQLKEELALNKSMVDTLEKKVRLLESENASLEIRKGQLKLEVKDLEKENEDLEKENLRLKEKE